MGGQKRLNQLGMMNASVVKHHNDLFPRVLRDHRFQKRQKDLCVVLFLFYTEYVPCFVIQYPSNFTYKYYGTPETALRESNRQQLRLARVYSPAASCNIYIDYCGYSGTPSASTPRIWASGEYNDGNGPRSTLYDTIQANSCLYNVDCTTS